MSLFQTLAPGNIVAADNKFAEVAIAGVGTIGAPTIALSFRTPPGLDGYITRFAQAWDGGLDPFLFFALRVNGGILTDYNTVNVQLASPAQDVDLPIPIRVEQLSLIEVLAFVTAGATFPGNFSTRVQCKYFSPRGV